MNLRVTPSFNAQNNRQNPNFGYYFRCNARTAKELRKLSRGGVTEIIEISDARTLYPGIKIPLNWKLYMTPVDRKAFAEAADKDAFVKQSRNITMADIKRVTRDALKAQEGSPVETADPEAREFRAFILGRLGVNISNKLPG